MKDFYIWVVIWQPVNVNHVCKIWIQTEFESKHCPEQFLLVSSCSDPYNVSYDFFADPVSSSCLITGHLSRLTAQDLFAFIRFGSTAVSPFVNMDWLNLFSGFGIRELPLIAELTHYWD